MATAGILLQRVYHARTGITDSDRARPARLVDSPTPPHSPLKESRAGLYAEV
jgi:hypothetical protein